MPSALLLPVFLRLLGPIAFIGAAIAAGVMNRSIMIVPLLALVAVGASLLVQSVSPSPAMDLKNLLNPGQSTAPPSPFSGLGRRIGLRVLGYGIVFGIAAILAAIFQATEFEPQIRMFDLGLAAIAALLAILGGLLSARLGRNQMEGMMDQMQDMFSQMQSAQAPGSPDEDAFTVEGEVIDPENRDS